MTTSYSRRYRHSRSAGDVITAKKNDREQTFFNKPSTESFFKPNQGNTRKCDQCGQQSGNGMDVFRLADENASQRSKAEAKSTSSSGKATNSKNQTHYGCEGVSVQGQTDANYTDSFTTTGTVKPSTKCPDCPDDCVSAKGKVVSVFQANPAVTLPAVPDGLGECETTAVAKFINTTLRKHEQKHVAAFNTYDGVVKTPYKYTGCQAGLDGYLQTIHDAINAKRTEAANKKSAKLDPFNPPIPCKCDVEN